MKGADKGPLALLEASIELEFYDIETDFEVYKEGIHTSNPLEVSDEPGKMVQEVEEKVLSLLDAGKFTVTIGGEHSVSVGAAKAHAKKFKNLSILHLDAHLDLREEYLGSPFNHACVAARMKETPIKASCTSGQCFSVQFSINAPANALEIAMT